MITFKVITYSTIAFIRAFLMNLFNFFCDSFVFFLTRRNTSVEPLVVSSTTYVPQPAKRLDWITVRFMLFFDCLIDVFVPDQTQPRLLSISWSFLKKMPPSQPVPSQHTGSCSLLGASPTQTFHLLTLSVRACP